MDFIKDNIQFIYVIISSLLAWFFTKRHFQNRELKSKDIHIDSQSSDLIQKNLSLYQNMIDDIERRYEEKIARLDAEILKLEDEISRLKEEIIKLKKDVR